MNHNIIYFIIAWSLLIYIGYNVLTAEATTDKKTIQKEMCVENYEAKWIDGKCHFSEASKKGPINDELEYHDDLADTDIEVYEDYAKRTHLKEKLLKQLINDDDNINRENADYFCDASEDYEANKKDCDKVYDKVDKKEQEEPAVIIEDWSNEVVSSPPSLGDKEFDLGPTTFEYKDEELEEQQQEEYEAFNESQEESAEEEDEPEEEEYEEQEEEEEDNSDSESEQDGE